MGETLYFAWIDKDEEFDPDVHNREDEEVFNLQYDQVEGDFAGLKVTLKNPRIGLLATGRKQWAVLSFDDGTTITPIFRGRLIAIPTNVFAELVELDFIARPPDFEDQKAALAETLKALPYYDPIFINPDSWDDPDVVLEARTSHWHIDPVTLEVSTSDIIIPEDGVETVDEDQHFYDDLSVTLNAPPLRSLQMTATIPWVQSHAGSVDLQFRIHQLFHGEPGTIAHYIPHSFTMEGLISDWPKPGGKFGNGWTVIEGSMTDVSGSIKPAPVPPMYSWQGTVPVVPEGSILYPEKTTGEFHSGEEAGFNFEYELVIAPLGYAVPRLALAYTANRKFGQVVTFTMHTDQQAIVTLPGDDEKMLVTVNANPVSDPTEDASIPIGDVRRRGYVHTERGMQSIEHLLLIARAHLISRSRAVEIEIKTGFKEGLRLLSLKKAMLLTNHRLPGGEAVGKIISAVLSVDGDSGEAIATIKIASCVGKGGSYTASAGTPSYVDGTLDGTQEYTGQVVLTDTEDLAWTIPDFEAFDDGIDFVVGLNANNAVKQLFITNDADTQRAALLAASEGPLTDQAKVDSVLQTIPTQIHCQMVPMQGGPFMNEVVIDVSDLVIEKQIDLEAPSNA